MPRGWGLTEHGAETTNPGLPPASVVPLQGLEKDVPSSGAQAAF